MLDAECTAGLARLALSENLPAEVTAQAGRAFLNYAGCALGGSRDPASRLIQAHADEFSGERRCTVFGQATRLDAQHAALVNAMQASVQGFDEVHLGGVIHPTGPVASALLALAEHSGLAPDGTQFLTALAVGIEVSCRVAVALATPDVGMNPGIFATGITGGLGAAAACARLLGLDAAQAANAFGIAAMQTGGLRAAHGTMSLSLVPGFAARAGLSAALMAARGVTGNATIIEAKNGLIDVLAPALQTGHFAQATDARFAMLDLSFKPYPCGVVLHPAIDACLEMAQARGTETVERVTLRVHPLALQFGGVRHPASGAQCNASLYHWCAAALLRLRAGLDEMDADAVRDPGIASLRERIHAQEDASLAIGEARAQATLASGRTVASHVTRTRGSTQRPLSPRELEDKFIGLAGPVIGQARAETLRTLLRSLSASDATCVARLRALAT